MHRRAFTGSLLSLLATAPALAQSGSAPTIPEEVLIQPAALADILKAGNPPPLLQVGFSVMYSEAHIPGSIYAGPTGTAAGIEKLKTAVKNFDKSSTVRQVIAHVPEAQWVFQEFGLDHQTQPELLDETIEQVALSQGQNPDELVVELNGLFG